MTGRKQQPMQQPEPLPESNEMTNGFTPQADAADGFLSAMQGEARRDTVSVYRQGPNGVNDTPFLFSVGVDEMGYEDMLSLIRRDYGPGEYRVKLRKDGRIAANQMVSIAAPRGADVVKPAAEPADGSARMVGELLGFMQKQQARTEEMQARSDERYMRLLETMLTNKGSGGGGGIGEALKVAETIVSMSGATRAADPMVQVKQFLELKELLSGDGPATGANDNDLILTGLREVAGPLAQVAIASMAERAKNNPVQRQPQPRPAALAQSPAVPVPPQVAAGVQTPVAGPGVPGNVMAELRRELDRLVRAAQADSDTGAYAVVVCDTFEESFIRSQLLGELAWRRLCSIAPAAAQHQEWFADLQRDIAAYLDALNAPDEDELQEGDVMPDEGVDSEGGET